MSDESACTGPADIQQVVPQLKMFMGMLESGDLQAQSHWQSLKFKLEKMDQLEVNEVSALDVLVTHYDYQKAMDKVGLLIEVLESGEQP